MILHQLTTHARKDVYKRQSETLWQTLSTIPDPEIPVVSLVEMGIVRAVEQAPDGTVTVTITPTFSGCPALDVMKTDIVRGVEQLGVGKVIVRVVLSPPLSLIHI